MDTALVSQILERLERLEVLLRANCDLHSDLSERVGETFSKQAFSVKDLALRWNCGETQVRKIIAERRLVLLKGSDRKCRRPIAVLRSSVLEYEKGLSAPEGESGKRATKPIPAWTDSPFLPAPALSLPFGKGVRRLGDMPCEQAMEKSTGRRNA